MLKIRQFVFSDFGVNTYLLIDEETLETAVVDPAMLDEDEQKRFAEYVEANGLKITQVINTHLHLDHCFGMDYVKNVYGAPLKAHGGDAPVARMMQQQYSMFGIRRPAPKVEIDVELKDGDLIEIGRSKVRVIHVPGHSPGGIALYYKEGNVALVGDSLFRRSIGRTDLYGSQEQLVDSIRKKLFTLPDNTLVLSGHGPSTTIGEEKAENPFV
ncbi:MAG: MBL fold metallo-hydrolase [Clostridium sp.]|nr:MBL fold metallo-hydrolase [Clostridium sp.]